MIVTFGLICLVLIIGYFIVSASKKSPIIGIIAVVCLVVFVIMTCNEYEEQWGEPKGPEYEGMTQQEKREHKAEKEMQRFHEEVEKEKEENMRKWEREHPEEVEKQKEKEKWLKENGYK